VPKEPRPDLDERFTLHPLEGEEALRALVAEDPDPEDDGPEDGPADDDG
jgi:hypothetical protein